LSIRLVSDIYWLTIDFIGAGSEIRYKIAYATNNIQTILYEAIDNVSSAKAELGDNVDIIPIVANIAEQKTSG
jgi:hypothetical protein